METALPSGSDYYGHNRGLGKPWSHLVALRDHVDNPALAMAAVRREVAKFEVVRLFLGVAVKDQH